MNTKALKGTIWLITLLLIFGFSSCRGSQSIPGADVDVLAEEFVTLMAGGKFKDATDKFDFLMKFSMSHKKLKEAWRSNTGSAGNFSRILEKNTTVKDKYKAVDLLCEFEKKNLNIRVVFDENKQISGLWFTQPVGAADYKIPKYANPEKYTEEEVTFGEEKWKLNGTLTYPEGNGPFPALILVHGSGPNDRDETLGSNKPFKDLATGLATRGIAVLRYDKRTFVYSLKDKDLQNFTIREESIDDAIEALDYLSRDKKIDNKRIFVLGHSLGGMLIPRIADAKSGFAGFIIMAGATRPLEDIILEQTKYIFNLDGKIDVKEKVQLVFLEKEIEKIKKLTRDDIVSGTKLLNAPVSYWWDLKNYNPTLETDRIYAPVLVIQGGRDYQVTEEDYENWKKGLEGRDDATFIYYDELNHLFIEGTGVIKPEEYTEKKGNVSELVIEDIGEWINHTGNRGNK